MKRKQIRQLGSIVFTALAIGLFSCKKESTLGTAASGSAIEAAIQNTGAIAVGATTAGSTSAADSIYVVNACSRGARKDSVSFSNLPASVSNYLSANYAGYTFQKAYNIKDASGTNQGYVVIIQYNGNPVGLKFDVSGNFIKVLEQREGRDLLNNGWHTGGHFEHRGDVSKDTIALNSLPPGILSYMSARYSSDTLLAASQTRGGAYVVLSKNNGFFATVFDNAGNFVNRVTLPEPAPREVIAAVAQSSLPASIGSYLSATFPAYVFEKAYTLTINKTVQGYVVVIEANSTKYAVLFDASGNFVKVKTVC